MMSEVRYLEAVPKMSEDVGVSFLPCLRLGRDCINIAKLLVIFTSAQAAVALALKAFLRSLPPTYICLALLPCKISLSIIFLTSGEVLSND